MATFLIQYACGHRQEKDGVPGPEAAVAFERRMKEKGIACGGCGGAPTIEEEREILADRLQRKVVE